MFGLVYSGEGASQPLVDDSSEEADPSCSAGTLSNEEYASLLEAAMRFLDKQDAQMSYAALANHRQPHLDCLAYLSQLVLYQINVSKLPLLALIYQNNTSWMFFRDPLNGDKQTDLLGLVYYVVEGRSNHAGFSCEDKGVVGKSYLPKSPLSTLPATGVLAGFGTDFMTNHAFGRGTVSVPVAWIDALVPHARVIFQAIRLRNRMRTGKADFSGQHCVESILYLAETFWQSSPFMLQRYGLGWWALQLPAVRFIVGSSSFRQFEQQVIDAELECNARPLSPQMTEGFDKISKQAFKGSQPPPLLCEQAIQRGQRLSKKAIDNLSRRRHLPLRIQALATDRCWPLKKALAVYELVMQRHSLSLAELRDAVRLSSPVRHPNAKGGKPAQSQHVNRSPGLPLISISQFAVWVQQAIDDIASMSSS
ncbi:TPA: hypothetical protein ACH3X1_009124 [Trebouxia sp. C0004]